PALSVSVDSGDLATGDDISEVTGTLTRETGETVGVYDIALGTGSKASNYDISFNADNDAFSITQRTITLTADAATKTYGDTDPAISVSVTSGDLATGDDLTEVTGALSRQSGELVGMYDIALGTDGTKTFNYNITFNADNDAFSITQRAITLTADAATKVYGEADPALSVTKVARAPARGDDMEEVTGPRTREGGK